MPFLITRDLQESVVYINGRRRSISRLSICLAGVDRVTTIEYNEIQSEHPQLITMTPESLARSWLSNMTKLYDFAASYSSYEHDGLGRYGDPVDPWGDIWDVRRVGCLIKPKGLLYLGVPVGTDQVNLYHFSSRCRD